MCHGSVMIRRSALSEMGWYDERVFAEDYDLWFRLGESFTLVVLPEILYIRREHEKALSVQHRPEHKLGSALAIRCAWQRRLRGRDELGRCFRPDILPVERREIAAEHCVIWAREALRQGRPGAAASLAARAVRLNPLNKRLWQALLRGPRALLRGYKV